MSSTDSSSVPKVPNLSQDLNLEAEPNPIQGLGSGVIVREDGYILTNNHVIDGVDHITVILANGREYPAEVSR